MRILIASLLAAMLTGCAPSPVPAEPALWRINGPEGQTGWLFGTIHALRAPAIWRTDEVAAALQEADTIVVEVASLGDEKAMSEAFAKLADSPGMPPLSERVAPVQKSALSALYRKSGLSDAALKNKETWAAALILARAAVPALDSEYGIDRAVLAAADGKRIVELEGARKQLAIFDALPEREQRDLLQAVIADADELEPQGADLEQAWRTGDLARIEKETSEGLLADPELRLALFTGRNRQWADRVAQLLSSGARPFVAVGAAHLVGSDGLPAMLSEKGYTIRRIQ